MLPPTRMGLDPELWDEEPLSETEMVDAIRQIHGILIKKVPSRDLNCSSPVALGRHIAAAFWHRDNVKVPPSPPEIRYLLKSTSPQGRHEILTLSHLETIPALYEYDMRLAYLWCCKSMPYGVMMRDDGCNRSHKQRCWWVAPEDWQGIGLLPARGMGWVYPVQGEGWLDRREVDFALRKDWSVRSREGIQWSEEGALNQWSDAIQWALRRVTHGGLLYRMLRRVALHTIGSFYSTTTRVQYSGPKAPTGIANARYDPSDGSYRWIEEEPIRGRGQIYMHPEWTTTIWARCRARMAAAALRVPREQLIAIRQDAIYTSVRQPQWEGKNTAPIVGEIRLKWWRDSDLERTRKYLPAPHTIDQLDTLRRDDDQQDLDV